MTTNKYTKPSSVVFWEFYQGRMPHMCFTCAHFANPLCKALNQEVPFDYAATENWNCEDYEKYETPDPTDSEEPCF